MPLKLPKTHRNHFETHIVHSHVVKFLLRLEMVLDEMYFLINNTLPTTFCNEYVSEPYLEGITVDAKDQRIDIEKTNYCTDAIRLFETLPIYLYSHKANV